MATSFGTAAKNDSFLAKNTGLTEDSQSIVYLDVMANDTSASTKKLWSLDDGTQSTVDLLTQDTARTAALSLDKSANGAKIWITADGKVGYDISTATPAFKTYLQTLNAGQYATDTFTYAIKATDGTISWATATVQIAGVNDAAVLSAPVVTLTEGSTAAAISTSGTVSISDVDSAATFVAQTKTTGQYGTFKITSSGAWTYTASTAHNEFVAGTTYTDTFTVSSSDGTKTTVTVKIVGTNDAAVLSSSTVNLTEGNTASAISKTGTLTISDVDSAATFVAQTGTVGLYGTFKITSAGAWTYTASSAHNEFQSGTTYTDTFNVASSDGTVTTVTVKILGMNDVPVATVDVASVTEGASVSGNVLANDDAGDGFPASGGVIQVSAVTAAGSTQTVTAGGVVVQGKYGVLTLNSDGSYSYQANGNSTTSTVNDVFKYTIKDSNGDTANNTLTITLKDAVPTAPVLANATSLTIDETPGLQNCDISGATAITYNGASTTVAGLFADLSSRIQVDTNVLASALDNKALSFTTNSTTGMGLVSPVTALNYGADGPAAVGAKDYTFVINNAASGLKLTDGTTITLSLDNNGHRVIGTVDSNAVNPALTGKVAFAIAIDPGTGQAYMAQYLSLNNSNAANPNDALSLNSGVLGVALTLTDNDGNSVTSAPIDQGGNVIFLDDAPTPINRGNITIAENNALVLNDLLKYVTPGADGIAKVTGISFDDPSTPVANMTFIDITSPVGADANGFHTIETARGVYMFSTTGIHHFYPFLNQDNSSGNFYAGFNYRMIDGDGDVVIGTKGIILTDGTNPSIGTAIPYGVDTSIGSVINLSVDEAALPTGSQPSLGTGVDQASLAFTAGSDNLEANKFAFSTDFSNLVKDLNGDGNQDLFWDYHSKTEVNAYLDADHTQLALTLVLTPSTITASQLVPVHNTGQIPVTMTLMDNLPHAAGADPSTALGSIKVIATDTDGDSASGTVNLAVKNDPAASSAVALTTEDLLSGGDQMSAAMSSIPQDSTPAAAGQANTHTAVTPAVSVTNSEVIPEVQVVVG